MENDKIFEFMTKMYADLKESQGKMYSEMQNGFENVNKKIGDLDKKVDNLEGKVGSLEAKVSSLRAIRDISKTSDKGEKAYDFIKELSNKNFGN
ncbi:hypothetical protein D4Z93_05225 [Clostridium fermenticellae]|uniref:Uncharacterized protein n=1 Tax=Clostridium fermenticellae TaxID=2068654 RepID=A0A386H2M8_9CLOT|nr:hypothetical protein [Clostridium fermenticellae]AYD39949.1 hypothetical protein D4Z93_05225 [Clostridium fermenticellae]